MALNLVKPTIAELRQLIGATQSEARPRHQFSLYPEGFFEGSFVELTGAGKTEFIALFLQENPTLKVAWIEETITVNPYALRQKKVNLDNVIFIEGRKELTWCLTQVLGSGCFQIIITQNVKFTDKDLRRFQLLSEKSQSHFFLLSTTAVSSWVPHLQLKITKNKFDWNIQTLRKRGVL